MADRPILFSAPMIRALLAGRKTQTRRVFKPRGFEFYTHPVSGDRYNEYRPYRDGTWDDSRISGSGPMRPFGWGEHLYSYLPAYPEDRLYVREAWHAARSLDGTPPRDIPRDADIEHAAAARNYAEIGLKGELRPGIFLPRWASRITLTVTDVRVERLKDISREDAIAEGLIKMPGAPSVAIEMGCDWGFDGDSRHGSPVSAYSALWNHINGEGAWGANPWVVAYTFSVHLGNIDQIGMAA